MSGLTLVTGAAGFAGSHLLDLLAADHMDVVAWRHSGGTPPAGPLGVRWQQVDLLNRRAVASRLAELRPSFVYHCAGSAHVGRAWEETELAFATNVRGTHHLVEELRDAGIPARVLIPGSAMVYAPANEPLTEDHPLRPSSPYGLSKLAQELLGGDADGAQVVIARAFNHFGPRQDPLFATSGFARRIAQIEAGRGEPVIEVGNLDARRDFTDVRDTVRAYRAILEHGVPGRTYNVCSGRAVMIGDLLELLLTRSRAAIRVAVDAARFRPNDQPLILGDPTRISTELGWAPTIPIEQTADDLLEYWRQQ